MLLSIVLTLSPLGKAIHQRPSGRAAQAWLLDQVRRLDPALAEELHAGPPAGKTADPSAGPPPKQRPYTVSALMDHAWRPVWERSAVPDYQPVHLRITSLSAVLSELLLEKLLPGLPDKLRLNEMTFKPLGWSVSPREHPWAGQTDFGELVRSTAQVGFNKITYDFASPTAFRSNGSDIPLPVPGSILRSWWHKWNDFAPPGMHIDPAWPLFADACVLVSKYDHLSTRRWDFGEGGHGGATGYVGEVELSLLPPGRAREWQAVYPGSRHVLHTLSRFALYCGTGHHATLGMGQTRCLERELGDPAEIE